MKFLLFYVRKVYKLEYVLQFRDEWETFAGFMQDVFLHKPQRKITILHLIIKHMKYY